MRDCILRLAEDRLYPDHLGLAYTVWAPVDTDPASKDRGKVGDTRRQQWLTALCAKGISGDYPAAYARWRDTFGGDGQSVAATFALNSRLLVGHGNESPTEVGITVHHTWGVPVIPGSALKGLLNHYVDAVYGPDRGHADHHPLDPGHPQPERAPYQGVTWQDRRILHGPGPVHRALFGAPPAMSDPTHQDRGAGEMRGLVTFHDALYVPDNADRDRPFAADVLTVHQRTYYNDGGQAWPNDYDSPNPVSFLSVKPGARFLLALSGPLQWTLLALDLLKLALEQWGVGGKTAAGYGRARPESWEETCRPWSEELRTFVDWMSAATMSQRQRLAAVEDEQWFDLLHKLQAHEKNLALELLAATVQDPALKEDLDMIIDLVRSP